MRRRRWGWEKKWGRYIREGWVGEGWGVGSIDCLVECWDYHIDRVNRPHASGPHPIPNEAPRAVTRTSIQFESQQLNPSQRLDLRIHTTHSIHPCLIPYFPLCSNPIRGPPPGGGMMRCGFTWTLRRSCSGCRSVPRSKAPRAITGTQRQIRILTTQPDTSAYLRAPNAFDIGLNLGGAGKIML